MNDKFPLRPMIVCALILVCFMVIANIFIKNRENELIANQDLSDVVIEKEFVSSALNTELFEILETNNSGSINEYIIADKKTGLCYLLFETQNGIAAIDYKDHNQEQFTIMSYMSYISPYEEQINVSVYERDEVIEDGTRENE